MTDTYSCSESIRFKDNEQLKVNTRKPTRIVAPLPVLSPHEARIKQESQRIMRLYGKQK